MQEPGTTGANLRVESHMRYTEDGRRGSYNEGPEERHTLHSAERMTILA